MELEGRRVVWSSVLGAPLRAAKRSGESVAEDAHAAGCERAATVVGDEKVGDWSSEWVFNAVDDANSGLFMGLRLVGADAGQRRLWVYSGMPSTA